MQQIENSYKHGKYQLNYINNQIKCESSKHGNSKTQIVREYFKKKKQHRPKHMLSTRNPFKYKEIG